MEVVPNAPQGFMGNSAFKTFVTNLSLADVILILVVLATFAFSSIKAYQNHSLKRAFIYKNNELFGIYHLNKDQRIEIDEHNIVLIKDNRVLMIEADCHDKRCVKQGGSDFLPIICLPNKVVIEIKQNAQERSKMILY